MRNIILFLSVLIMGTMNAVAQSSLISTLNHEGNITTYYGADAFAEAMNDAVDGDAITLSAGKFNNSDITKAVTLRGAGMEQDEKNNQEATIIDGSVYLKIENPAASLYVEGISFPGYLCFHNDIENPVFVKCSFYNVSITSNIYRYINIKNASFTHCKIYDRLLLYGESYRPYDATCSFDNCIVNNWYYRYCNVNMNFTNCVMCYTDTRYSLDYGHYTNCIIIDGRDGTNKGSTTNRCQNCVAISNNQDYFKEQTNSSNRVATLSDIFKEYNPDMVSRLTFELTELAKANYKGTDGTEVGIYGGQFPYTSTTSVPHITSVKVDPTSTEDGHLKVTVNIDDLK